MVKLNRDEKKIYHIDGGLKKRIHIKKDQKIKNIKYVCLITAIGIANCNHCKQRIL